MLDAAFANPIAADLNPHPLPTALDAQSYSQGRLGEVAKANLTRGFKLDPVWSPPVEKDSQFVFGKSTEPLSPFRNKLSFLGGLHHPSGPKADPHV